MMRRLLVGTGIGALVTGLAVLFALAGLDNADKLASVTGALIAILSLGVTLWLAANRPRSESPPSSGAKYNVTINRSEDIRVGDGDG